MRRKTVLYIGGFELPDKNAAAQRVTGIAKGLRTIGYNVVFLNSIKTESDIGIIKKTYFGFNCYEYRREKEMDYLITGKTVLAMLKKIKPSVLIAYNYPAVALYLIRNYCKKNTIKCYADITEWYEAAEGTFIYRTIKNIDTFFRMRFVQKRMDGVIVISRFLYDYYKNTIKTVMIPPTVDIDERKWRDTKEKDSDCVSFVYAGSPSRQKERLDLIVNAINRIERQYKVQLNIVGITEDNFRRMYSWNKEISERIVFWGRIEHQQVLDIIKVSDWSIILRENNRVVRAGFPTKVVESISCGTPVIANQFSNINEYLNDSNSIRISYINEIHIALEKAIKKEVVVDASVFDYHNYISELEQVVDSGSA